MTRTASRLPLLCLLLTSLLACGGETSEEPAGAAGAAGGSGASGQGGLGGSGGGIGGHGGFKQPTSCPTSVTRCQGGKLTEFSCDPCASPNSVDCALPSSFKKCDESGACAGPGETCPGSGGSGGSGGGASGSGGAPQGGSGGTPQGGIGGQGGAPETCQTAEECASFKTPPDQQAAPPPKNGGGTADGTAALLHGASKLYVGDTDRQDVIGYDAWKDFGFDIDGWTSTAKQGFHCKPRAGAKSVDIRPDGNKGIDNSFGKHIVNELLVTLVSDPSHQFTQSFADGASSLVFDLGKLGASASYDSAPSQLFFVTGQTQSNGFVAPGEDWTSYLWHPRADGLEPDGTSKTKFPDAYLANNIWVSGIQPKLTMTMTLQGAPLEIPIHLARATLDVSDRKRGVNGNLGGVINTEELVTSFKKLAGNFGASFCGEGSSALQGVLDVIRQASDILQDGTQDPNKECDGISIGLGFETKVTGLGEPTQPPPTTDPCLP